MYHWKKGIDLNKLKESKHLGKKKKELIKISCSFSVWQTSEPESGKVDRSLTVAKLTVSMFETDLAIICI